VYLNICDKERKKHQTQLHVDRYSIPKARSTQRNVMLQYNIRIFLRPERNAARVFRSDSPGEAAQWLARSIRES
jgi:hypothetical protein